jgi:hypothetical protein
LASQPIADIGFHLSEGASLIPLQNL